jgi:hypothetical protein
MGPSSNSVEIFDIMTDAEEQKTVMVAVDNSPVGRPCWYLLRIGDLVFSLPISTLGYAH